MAWFTEVELELLAAADPVVIDADDDEDDEVAELEPVDDVAVEAMCAAEVADIARSLRVCALKLEDQDSRPTFTLAAPPGFGWQAADGRGAGVVGAPGGVVGVCVPGDAWRGRLAGGVVNGLPILAWELLPVSLKLIHAAPATPSDSDRARAPTPVATTRCRRCARKVTAASIRAGILGDGE